MLSGLWASNFPQFRHVAHASSTFAANSIGREGHSGHYNGACSPNDIVQKCLLLVVIQPPPFTDGWLLSFDISAVHPTLGSLVSDKQPVARSLIKVLYSVSVRRIVSMTRDSLVGNSRIIRTSFGSIFLAYPVVTHTPNM